MSPIKKLLFCAVVLMLSSLMCALPNPQNAGFDTRLKVQSTDLTGKYAPIGSTLQLIRDKGRYKAVESYVILSLDDTFEMSNMPDWWRTPGGEPKGGFDSGRGKWSIAKNKDWYEVRFEFSSPAGLKGTATLVGDRAPQQLWFYVGDPKDERIMIFEQAQSK